MAGMKLLAHRLASLVSLYNMYTKGIRCIYKRPDLCQTWKNTTFRLGASHHCIYDCPLEGSGSGEVWLLNRTVVAVKSVIETSLPWSRLCALQSLDRLMQLCITACLTQILPFTLQYQGSFVSLSWDGICLASVLTDLPSAGSMIYQECRAHNPLTWKQL